MRLLGAPLRHKYDLIGIPKPQCFSGLIFYKIIRLAIFDLVFDSLCFLIGRRNSGIQLLYRLVLPVYVYGIFVFQEF